SVDAEAHAADDVRGDLGCGPIGPVVADDRNHVAPADAELGKAEREITDASLVICPGDLAPQAKVLLAQRNFVCVLFGIEPQQLWKGVGLGDAGGVVDHPATSAGVGASSGSTSSSSSSPR